MNFTALFLIALLVLLGLVHDEERVSNVAREAFFNGKIISNDWFAFMLMLENELHHSLFGTTQH